MSRPRAVELFGPDWPDRDRLASDSGLPMALVDSLTDDLRFVVKTCTRLGWSVDLESDPQALLALDDESFSEVRPGVRLFGHPSALNGGSDGVLNPLNLLVALCDRRGSDESTQQEQSFMTALTTQSRDLTASKVRVVTAAQDLGLEKLIEEAIEEAPELLAHHGYDIVRSPQRQTRLGNGKRPDLIAGLRDGSTLVIELKRFGLTDEAVDQCAGYVDFLRLDEPGRRVRGLVLGDGVGDFESGTGRDDIDALPLRLLDLPSARAQRWMWWTRRPAKPELPPHAVIAVAADSMTPVAVWPSEGRQAPVAAGDYGAWTPIRGWCCPVPLDWDRDSSTWSREDRTELVRQRLDGERAGRIGRAN